jgi:hypothetical protein
MISVPYPESIVVQAKSTSFRFLPQRNRQTEEDEDDGHWSCHVINDVIMLFKGFLGIIS